MPTGPAPSSAPAWRGLARGAGQVLGQGSWWRQQAWVGASEILMGFLAAWGLLISLHPATLGGGLGATYATSTACVWSVNRWGRPAGLAMLALGLAAVVATAPLGPPLRWLGMAVAAGVLLGFRDHQGIHSMAWVPLRARRGKVSHVSALTASTLMSGVGLAIVLPLAGWWAQHWQWLPQFIVLLALGALVPHQLARMGRSTGRPSGEYLHAQVGWLLRVALWTTAINVVGRRLLLPVAMLAIATAYGMESAALPVLGGALGLMGLVGMVARLPLSSHSAATGRQLLVCGVRASLAAWSLLALAFAGWASSRLEIAIVPMLLGWAVLETANRVWSVAYNDALREGAWAWRLTNSRRHRQALARYMVRKSAGGALGCALGGLLPAAFVPALVVVLATGAWMLMGRHPAAPRSHPEDDDI